MPIPKRWLTAIAMLGALFYGSQNYSIEGFNNLRIRPKGTSASNPTSINAESGLSIADRLSLLASPQSNSAPLIPHFTSLAASSDAAVPTLRIASFNLHLFGAAKISKPHVMEALVKIVRRFDVIAIQEVNGREQDLLPILIQRINQSGRKFDYLIGPRVGQGDFKIQLGFLFDTEKVETDRYQLYTVDDPMDLVSFEPLVGWFRTKEINPDEAFTFSAVNIHIDPNRIKDETRILPELLTSIQRDGRGEDDILLMGDFCTGDRQLDFMRNAGMAFALEGVPTTTRGDEMLDNILFPIHATEEYTGRSGVIDYLREMNLSIDEALEVSNHLPIWAEFFVLEGGQHGRVAKPSVH